MKSKSINKRIFLFAIIISMVMSFIPANALSLNKTTLTLNSGEKITLTKSQLNDVVEITSEEAEEIAIAFVSNMVAIGNVDWNEQTSVVSVVAMYDNSNSDEITAYTINFDIGYVVVSAYLDAESLIPEWSDKATPLYEELDIDDNDKVIYLGTYEYYADDGTATVKGLNGIQTQKSELTNFIEPTRDVKHIPDEHLYSFYEDKTNSVSNRSGDNTISNPADDAPKYFRPNEGFVVDTAIDYWSSYMPHYTDSYGESRGYYYCCVPVAITNSLRAYKRRYPASAALVPDFDHNTFIDVAEYGKQNNYYSNSLHTPEATKTQFILGSYHKYNLTPTITDYNTLGTYNRLKQELLDNNMLFMTLGNHEIYQYHTVLCYGLIRYRGLIDGYYLSYMKIADGAYASPRYITVASALNSRAISISF